MRSDDYLKKEHKKFSEIELTKGQYRKLKGLPPKPGRMLKIYWRDGIIDYGYIFALPINDYTSDFDFFINVPRPDNSAGIGDVPPIWQHLNNILSNDLVKRITISNKKFF